MPELPEVETVKRGLEPHLLGQSIQRVRLNRSDLRQPFPANFAHILEGRKVIKLSRRAKYILVHLDQDWVWVIHLGMSGSIRIFTDSLPSLEKHDHVVVALENGTSLIYNDPRRFGLMDLLPYHQLKSHKLFARLGPEPFGKEFSPSYLKRVLSTKSGPIKTVLLDQSVVVGLGNIYVCETLFRSKLNPTAAADQVKDRTVAKIVEHTRSVLTEAIESGGSSLRDYVQTDGELGYFQHHFQVYDREGLACVVCGHQIRRIVQANRSTFYCGNCQK